LDDLSSALPDNTRETMQALLGRMVQQGILERVCRGVYLYPDAYVNDGLLLYHIAARLRAGEFNYLSLESVLSDAGVISQIPVGWITLMSSGRNRIVHCGRFGRIEFIHTQRKAADLAERLTYDSQIRLWRASVELAIQDMKHTHRNRDLIDWMLVDEQYSPFDVPGIQTGATTSDILDAVKESRAG
jgi:hypothetical protein